MRSVRNHPEARWLPSRYRFAFFRLYALMRFSLAEKKNAPPDLEIVLPIDRDQSNHEQYGVALLVLATVASFIAVLLPLPVPISIPLSIPLATFAVQVPMLATGWMLRRGRDNTDFHGFVLMMLIAAAAAWFATGHTWARFAAWIFLAALLVNGLAWALAFAFRGRMAALGTRYGGAEFEI